MIPGALSLKIPSRQQVHKETELLLVNRAKTAGSNDRLLEEAGLNQGNPFMKPCHFGTSGLLEAARTTIPPACSEKDKGPERQTVSMHHTGMTAGKSIRLLVRPQTRMSCR